MRFARAALAGFALIVASGCLDPIEEEALELLLEETTISLGDRPTYGAFAPDGSTLAVSIQSPPVPNRSAGGEAHVALIDPQTGAIRSRLNLGAGFPFQIAMQGPLAYVAISQAAGTTVSNGFNRVAVLDVRTGQPLAAIRIPGNAFGPIGVALSPSGRHLYVTQRGSGWLVVVSTETRAVTTLIPVGASAVPVGVAVAPDGDLVYIANRVARTLSVVDPALRRLIRTIPLSLLTSNSNTASVAVSPDGRRVYVARSCDPRIAVVDEDPQSPMYHREIAQIPTTGAGVGHLAFAAEGRILLASSFETNELLAIDTDPASPRFHTQVAKRAVGARPVGLAYHEALRTATVCNWGDGTATQFRFRAMEVPIDLRPGSDENPLNLKGRGLLPVAVLSTPEFDALRLISVLLGDPDLTGRSLPERFSDEDVDGDGRLDRLYFFSVRRLVEDGAVGSASTALLLTGRTSSGWGVRGRDAIRIARLEGRPD